MSKSVLGKIKEAEKEEIIDKKDETEVSESKSPVTDFDMTHNDPQFVIDGPIKVRIEANKFVQFDDLEPVELVENPTGNLQIGTGGNVIEIDNEKLASKFLEYVTHKDDVKTEEKEVTVAEAITSNLSSDKVARMIVDQFSKEDGSLSKLKEGNSMVKIKVARKIRSLRSTAMKAASVRPFESKDKSFIMHKALEIVK